MLLPTTSHEIENITSDLTNKSSFGYDDIPLKLLKSSISGISVPLSHLINISIVSGIFPDKLKIAKITPLYKSGDKADISNYRPISVLTSFSKVFERVIHNSLMSYLDKNNILNPTQFGFRKQHSTNMALIDLIDCITNAIDKNEYSIGIFIDLSKAFDTIDHDILLYKLSHYGIRGISLSLFASYLQHREQFVCLNSVVSDYKTVSCGVPQGSILGPLLFIIFINDIINCSNILHFILFADDTNLLYSCNNIDTLVSTINSELSKLASWFRSNKLSLNVKKTNYMMFGNKIIPEIMQPIHIDNILIDRVTSTKFLGVIVDDKISWKDHIALLSLKISRGIGAINRIKHLVSPSILLLLYYTMVLAHLSYCCVVWGNACTSNLQCLRVLQKRSIRLLSHAAYRTPSTPLFAKHQL